MNRFPEGVDDATRTVKAEPLGEEVTDGINALNMIQLNG